MANDPFQEVHGFRTTRWSLLDHARDIDPELRRAALDELLRLYYPALRSHLVLHKRIPRDWADDLLQGFVTEKILDRDLLAHADPSKGKFRSLLVRSLNNYVVDRIRHEQARRPRGTQEIAPEFAPAGPQTSPSQVFDVAWARQVVREALRRMQATLTEKRRLDIWGVFEKRILIPVETGCPPIEYSELAKELGFASAEQASNALVTAKRQFNRVLRSVVSEYCASDENIDDEIAALRGILATAGPLAEDCSSDRTHEAPSDASGTLAAAEEMNPASLSKLFAVTEELHGKRTPQELGALLIDELSRRLAEEFPAPGDPFATATLEPTSDLAAPDASALDTLADLFRHPAPPIEMLRDVKRWARDRARERTSATPADISSLIYFASIAAALVRRGTRITKSDDEILREGFRMMLEQPWLDEATARLLRDGLIALDSSR